VKPQLTLNADSTFAALDLPYESSGADLATITRSGHGTWSIRVQEGAAPVRLTFDGGFGAELSISDFWSDGPGSPTTLYYFIGDPDFGRRIQLTRK
jgi:hypothetical protein